MRPYTKSVFIPFFYIIILFTSTSLFAQQIEWQKSLGGSSNDGASSIEITTDGGYIVAGASNSNDGDVTGNHGAWDIWVVMLDSSGNLQWQKALGGSLYDKVSCIRQTDEGGYIVAGSSKSNDGDVTGNHGNYDFWVVKLDVVGNLQWQKSLGGSGIEEAYSIQQTSDGGYIVAGLSDSTSGDVTGNHGHFDAWIVKLDTAGNLQWQKSYGGSGYDRANSIKQTNDGGYIMAGQSFSTDGDVTGNHGDLDYWIVKLDTAGNIQWQKSLGGSGDDRAGSIEQTIDGGYIIAGKSKSTDGDVTGNHGNFDYWIVKLDTAGNVQWQNSLGGSATDEPQEIRQHGDGSYVVVGFTASRDGDIASYNGGFDYWIVGLDSAGNLKWQKALGGSGWDFASSIQQSSDGGHVIAGVSKSDDGDVTGNHGLDDYWIVKLSPFCLGSTAVTINPIACDSYTSPSGDNIWTTSGIYTDVIPNAVGCDSVITINLTVRTGVYDTLSTPQIEWQKSLGGSGDDFANSIQQTTDGGFVVAGNSFSRNGDVTGYQGSGDYWIVKLNAMGFFEWQKSLGGSQRDIASSIQQTTDGGFVVAGETYSNDGDVTGNHGNADCWIVKLDSVGILQWQKSLGGSGFDKATNIRQTTDGGYIVCGYSSSTDGDVTGNHGNVDFWIVKLDSVGILQWQKSLGGSGMDRAFQIQQTNDGGYVVAGISYSNDGDVTGNHGSMDAWIVKLDSFGTLLWQKSLGGSDDDEALSIQTTLDGGYVVAGSTGSLDGDVIGFHGYYDAWVVKLDSAGNLQWQKPFGGVGYEVACLIQQTTDGGYVIAGSCDTTDGDVTGNHGYDDYWIVKMDSVGNLQWQKSLGGSNWDAAFSGQLTMDGGLVLAGYSQSSDGDVIGNRGGSDYWIVKLYMPSIGATNITACDSYTSSNGNIIWTSSGTYVDTLTSSIGCDSAISINLTVATDCVWPGDANSDGIANNFDGLKVAVAMNSSGTPRVNPTILWEAQAADPWTQNHSDGINYKYSDCEGNGIVDSFDFDAINQNFGLTHPKTGRVFSKTGVPLFMECNDTVFKPNTGYQCNIQLGTAGSPVDSAYGIAFNLAFDATIIDANSISLNAANSWLGQTGTNLYQIDHVIGNQLYATETRLDNQNISGYGTLATLSFTTNNTIGDSVLEFSFTDAELINNNGVDIDLSPEDMELFASPDDSIPDGIAESINEANNIYPNPTDGMLYIDCKTECESIKLFNALGQVVLQTELHEENNRIDISHLVKGVYIADIGGIKKKIILR